MRTVRSLEVTVWPVRGSTASQEMTVILRMAMTNFRSWGSSVGVGRVEGYCR